MITNQWLVISLLLKAKNFPSQVLRISIATSDIHQIGRNLGEIWIEDQANEHLKCESSNAIVAGYSNGLSESTNQLKLSISN